MIKPHKGSLHILKIITRAQNALVMILIVLIPTQTFAGFPEEQPGSRAAGMSYSATALTDGWSLFYNQAGLGYQTSPWIGVHHENRFISPDLNFSALGALLPVGSGTIGISLKRLGFSQFSQTKVGLAYGMKLAPTLSAGVQLNVHHVYIAGEYGSTSAFTAEGGIIYTPNSNLNVGLHILNPTRSRLFDDERIPTILNLGIAYKISDMVLVTTGVEKNLDADFSFNAGIEFIPIENLSFRTGMASNPSLLSFGIGYQVASIQIDFAFTRHEILGYTPHFSLSYVFGKEKNSASTDPDQQ
jgi:opacity protein-like surface antigen